MYAIHPHYLNSSDLVPGVVYLSRPYLVSGLAAVSWPSLTRVVSGQRRGQDEEMFTFVCNMQQEPAQLSSAHILCPGLKITQLIQMWHNLIQ